MKEIIEKMLVSPTLLRVLRVFRIGRILRLVKSATAAMRPLATSSVAEARPGLSVAASASRQVGQGHPDAAVLAGRVPAGAVQHRSRQKSYTQTDSPEGATEVCCSHFSLAASLPPPLFNIGLRRKEVVYSQ